MCVCSSVGQSNGLLSRGSGVRIPSSTLCGGYGAVGQRARLWFWISWVRVPLPTLFYFIGLSPSGKAQDFDSCIRWFESNQPSFYGRVAQVVEHLTFNQVVRGSNPRTLTKRNPRKPNDFKGLRGFFAFCEQVKVGKNNTKQMSQKCLRKTRCLRSVSEKKSVR